MRPRSDTLCRAASVRIAPSGVASIAAPRDCGLRSMELEHDMASQSVESTYGGGVAIDVPEDDGEAGPGAESCRLASSNTT